MHPGTPQIPSSPESTSPWRIPGWSAAIATGLMAGLLLRRADTLLGGDPGGLAWASAMPVVALGLASLVRGRLGRAPVLALGAAGLGSLAFPSLLPSGAGLLSHLVSLPPPQGLFLVLVSWLLASTLGLLPYARARCPHPLLTGLLAAGGLALAALLPPWATVCALASLFLAALRSEGHPSTPVRQPSRSSTLQLALAAAVGAWATGHLWCALRASFDPTPFALMVCLVAAVIAFTCGQTVMSWRSRRWDEPLFLASAVLFAMLVLSVAVPWLEPRMPSLLLDGRPRAVLPLLLAVPCAVSSFLAGLACPSPRDPPAVGWPVLVAGAIGFLLGVHLGPIGATLLPVAAILLGAATLVFGSLAGRRVSGFVMAAIVSAALWHLPPIHATSLTAGWHTAARDEATLGRHLAGLSASTWRFASWGPQGSMALRRLDDVLVADLDGTALWPLGRTPSAVRFAGHLPPLLAGQSNRFLVMGDDLGWATSSLLAHGPTSILVAVMQPELMRVLTEDDDDLQRRLLAPQVQLHPVPGRWLLRASDSLDGVLQVVLRPWSDTAGGLPCPDVLALIRRRLQPDGVYVGVFATDRLPDAELRWLLGSFADTFPAGVACLPPVGADHLLLVGPRNDHRLDWSTLSERVQASATFLGASGITDALDVADRCVFPSSALEEWSQRGHASPRWPPASLPPTLDRPPMVHVDALEDLLAEPSMVWDLGGDEQAEQALVRRVQTTAHFLTLLGETRTGNMEALFEEARALQATEHGQQELDALIAPHLRRAREAMDQARRGGIQHKGWQMALNELTLARMLHPRAVEPILLLALVREARQELRSAEALFQAVLESEPGHVDALFGLARVQIAGGDPVAAEETLLGGIEAHPREWSIHQNLGVLLMRLGRFADAEPVLHQAGALAPENEAAPQAALAEAYLGLDRPQVAMAQAERAVRLEPTAYHFFLEGRCHYELDRDAAAERAFQQAVFIEPTYYLARGALGQIFAERGDLNQAADAFRTVLVEDPGNESALRNLQEAERRLDAQKTRPGLDGAIP